MMSCLEHIGRPVIPLTSAQDIHMTDLNLASRPDPAIGPQLYRFMTTTPGSLSTSKLPSHSPELLLNYLQSSDVGLDGSLHCPEIYTWQPMLYGYPTFLNEVASESAKILHIDSVPDSKSETFHQIIFLWMQYFLVEMFTCNTCAFKEMRDFWSTGSSLLQGTLQKVTELLTMKLHKL